jgi:hypothetical protein
MGNKQNKQKIDVPTITVKNHLVGDTIVDTVAVQNPIITNNTSQNPSELSEEDLKFLKTKTGLSKDELKVLFEKYIDYNPNSSLKYKEAVHNGKRSEFICQAFDSGIY